MRFSLLLSTLWYTLNLSLAGLVLVESWGVLSKQVVEARLKIKSKGVYLDL